MDNTDNSEHPSKRRRLQLLGGSGMIYKSESDSEIVSAPELLVPISSF